MILKTKVKNKTNVTRNLRWAGVKGISIAPEEVLEIEGGYPTACRNEQCKKQFKSEMDTGLIEVTIQTDMNTEKIIVTKAVKTETPKVEEVKTETPKVEEVKKPNVSDVLFISETPEEVRKSIEDPVFMQGPMDAFFKKSFPENEVIALDGEAGIPPEKRAGTEEQPIFKDAKNLNIKVNPETVFTPEEVEPVKSDSGKVFTEEVKPAKRRRKKSA